ncbi:DUF1223 domain-containing protein [Thioclava sp. BHET1]|nr:DUF1223 domain-containing protein [Thioclava sp. BHET1]
MSRASLSVTVSVCLGLAAGALWQPIAANAQQAPKTATGSSQQPQSQGQGDSASSGVLAPDVPPEMRHQASQSMLDTMAAQTGTEIVHDPIVVELYTSQGCSSCPPADALFSEYADRDDVLALALHVDYWDYLGWKDPFGRAEFTARQKSYARAAGERTIYTPQMMIEGTQALVGVQRDELKAAIKDDLDAPQPVTLDISGSKGDYQLALAADPPLSQPAVVQIVRYLPEARVDILRGENAGQTVDYRNIVTEWRTVAEWDGKTPTQLNVRFTGKDKAAVIVQMLKPGARTPLLGAIVAAGRLE